MSAPTGTTQVGPAHPLATPPTEQDCLTNFREALKVESRKATFTCGGRIPIDLRPNREESGDLTPCIDVRATIGGENYDERADH